MNYIFPTIFVRMNDVYLLTKEEKIMVHIAGISTNVIMNSMVMIFAYIIQNDFLFAITQFYVIGIMMNIAPVLNSDGYKILLTFNSSNEKKEKVHNSPWIKIVGYTNILLCIIRLYNVFFNN